MSPTTNEPIPDTTPAAAPDSTLPVTNEGETSPPSATAVDANLLPAETTPPKPVTPLPVTDFSSDAPSQKGQMVIGGSSGQSAYNISGTPGEPSRFWNKRKLLLGGVLTGVIILLGGGAVFGLYLPNKPENVWTTAVGRTGTAIQSMLQKASDPKKIVSLRSLQVTGDYALTSQVSTIQGTLKGSLDGTNGQGDVTATIKNAPSQQAVTTTAAFISAVPKDATYPDLYLKLSNISGLGLDMFVPNISKLDGKWLTVSSAYLDGQAKSPTVPTAGQTPVSIIDVAAASQAVWAVTQQYVFTNDAGKAVLENKGFLGKETVEGVNSYHYKAVLNKLHATAYCEALGQAVGSTTLFTKLVAEKNRAPQLAAVVTDCKNQVNSSKASGVFDVWIDGHYKLIHQVRLHDSATSASYSDLGFTYKDDDKLYLFAARHDAGKKADQRLNLTLNTELTNGSGTLTAQRTLGGTPYNATVRFQLKASSDTVKVIKPTTTINLEDTIKQLSLSAPMPIVTKPPVTVR